MDFQQQAEVQRERNLAGALAACMTPPPNLAQMKLATVVTTFEKWLYLPDPMPLFAVLGTVAANLMPGDPVWLLLIGPPGGGKTELLQPLAGLPDVHVTSTLTEPSLLSGTPARDKSRDASGGLLRTIGGFGVLLCKDFGSVISMHRDSRASVLAALREIYDGSWTRHVGADGGRTLHWQGKLGFIGACTSVIDNHHAVIAAMGERFIMYRLPAINENEMAGRALDHQGSEPLMRKDLSRAVGSLFNGLTLSQPEAIKGPEKARLVALSTLAVRCRSAVEREGYTREVELIPESEAPGRLALALARLLGGVTAIGASRADAWRVVSKVAMDCLPALRLRVMAMLAGASGAVDTATVATALRYPTQTTRRALEDLTAHNVVKRASGGQGRADTWRLSEWTRQKCEDAGITFPEMSDGDTEGTFPEMSGGE
jgi:hypothetical protein